MSELKELLKNKWVNNWNLFFLISLPISAFMFVPLLSFESITGAEISEMISFSVRWAVPFIYLVIAISSLQILFPNTFTRWLMRNRKYIGLVFAVAMAWQGLFIFIMSYYFHDYYFSEVYYFRDEIEGSIGYIFLMAMVLTSFKFGSKMVSSSQWRIIHKTGVYFLWAYPFSVYWWAISYYGNPLMIDYLFYWMGFLAFLARIVAWGKMRYEKFANKNMMDQYFGILVVLLGLTMSVTSLYWQTILSEYLTFFSWSATFELWLPFWPFEPFLSLMITGLGVMLLTRNKDSEQAVKNTIPTQ